MTKPKFESPDMTQKNIDKISQLFPNCITETKDENGSLKKAVNFEMLKQLLTPEALEGDEAYEFTWVGKKAAIVEANKPIRKTLRPCKEESVNWDSTENLYIEGDNLEVLKLLQESYLGKVKMIYIDPPYNTGNDFIYRDDFASSSEEYAEDAGLFDEEGNRMFKNTDTNGRFHSDWCSMIYSRLLLARNLLTEDGVIFISIDQNEFHNLKKICDEIYGVSNYITDFVWSAGRKNDSKHVSVSHEYMICYFKSFDYIKERKIIWREKKQGLDDIYGTYEKLKKKYGADCKSIETELKSWYKSLPDGHPAKDHEHYNRVDEKGIFFADNISWPGGGGPKYEVLHPVTKKPVKIPSRGWLTSEENMKSWIANGRVEFGSDENAVPTLKSYLKDREFSVPYSVFYKDGRAASKRLATLLGDKVFENPKDEEVIQRIIQFSGTSENDIILDFFSGSGTTAHALFLANVEQKINRKFILVQIPQEIDEKKSGSEKSKKVAQNAIKLLDSINVPHNICELAKERIRRAGQQILKQVQNDKEKMSRGFRIPMESHFANTKSEENSLFKEAALADSNPRDNNGGVAGVSPAEGVAEKPKALERGGDFPHLDIGFRVLKVDDSNMKDVYYSASEYDQSRLDMFESNIKEDRNDLDLLFGCLLDWGLPLSLPYTSKTVGKYTVHTYNGGDLVACFDEDVSEELVKEIARTKPLRAVFRDSSFSNSASKINVFEIFKMISPETSVKVI